jgi:hypothetical protein
MFAFCMLGEAVKYMDLGWILIRDRMKALPPLLLQTKQMPAHTSAARGVKKALHALFCPLPSSPGKPLHTADLLASMRYAWSLHSWISSMPIASMPERS